MVLKPSKGINEGGPEESKTIRQTANFFKIDRNLKCVVMDDSENLARDKALNSLVPVALSLDELHLRHIFRGLSLREWWGIILHLDFTTKE